MPPRGRQELVPDWSIHPGTILRQVLEERGIRQAELAERTGLTAKHINQIVTEGIGISGDVALLLERALGIDARFWTRADADYQAYSSKQKARAQVQEYTAWAGKFDTATLRRYSITGPGDEPAASVEKILRFFGVASPEAFEQTWLRPRASFRRSQAFTVAEQNTALWLRLVERSAEHVTVPQLRPGLLRKAARTIPAMTNLAITDGFTAARTALAEAGVILTFVREVPETRVCGATWWLGAHQPVIALTARGRKPDSFWFNLLHEAGHILLHPRRTTFLDLGMDKTVSDPAEQQANTFAQDTLLPAAARAQITQAATREQLLLLAARLGVGVTIVAGHHGYATNKWNIGGTLRGKITDDDIDMLETISGSQGDRANLYTRHPAAADETCTPAIAPQLVAIAAGSAANHATRPVGALTDPVVATWIVVDDATGLQGDRPHPRSSLSFRFSEGLSSTWEPVSNAAPQPALPADGACQELAAAA